MPVHRRRTLAAAAPFALAATLLATPAVLAQAPAPAPARTITANGTGRVAVARNVAQNSKAIAAAVEAARDKAVPLAIANARQEAQRLATAGGLTLGPLVSVSEPQPSPFIGPAGGAYGSEGTFGPGRFCGQIRTPIRRRNAAGRLVSTGHVRSRFGCRVPAEVSQTVTATFAVS
jgi:hypothetical protein